LAKIDFVGGVRLVIFPLVEISLDRTTSLADARDAAAGEID